MLFFYLRIIAIVILFSCSITYLLLDLRETQNRDLIEQLDSTTLHTFGTLERAQTIAIPGMKNRYFYSYSGRWDGRQFSTTEELPEDLFHIMAEGENVQLKLYQSKNGDLYTHIANNPLPGGRNIGLIKTISETFTIFSLLLLLFSFVSGRRATNAKD